MTLEQTFLASAKKFSVKFHPSNVLEKWKGELLQSLNLREGRFYQLMVNTNLRFKLVQSPYNMSSTSFPI